MRCCGSLPRRRLGRRAQHRLQYLSASPALKAIRWGPGPKPASCRMWITELQASEYLNDERSEIHHPLRFGRGSGDRRRLAHLAISPGGQSLVVGRSRCCCAGDLRVLCGLPTGCPLRAGPVSVRRGLHCRFSRMGHAGGRLPARSMGRHRSGDLHCGSRNHYVRATAGCLALGRAPQKRHERQNPWKISDLPGVSCARRGT